LSTKKRFKYHVFGVFRERAIRPVLKRQRGCCDCERGNHEEHLYVGRKNIKRDALTPHNIIEKVFDEAQHDTTGLFYYCEEC
jgi:hypothetical protein